MLNVATWAGMPLCWSCSRPSMTPIFPTRIPGPSAHFTRFERVLDSPHGDLVPLLSLESLAEQRGWPCWQLQRIFLHETGQTMAHAEKTLN